jgi:hypothetical protein
MTDTSSLAKRNGHPPGRLRELPPFGEPDQPYPGPTGDVRVGPDDPRGVYLPPPEATAEGRR